MRLCPRAAPGGRAPLVHPESIHEDPHHADKIRDRSFFLRHQTVDAKFMIPHA
jgi:hypothetical protein